MLSTVKNWCRREGQGDHIRALPLTGLDGGGGRWGKCRPVLPAPMLRSADPYTGWSPFTVTRLPERVCGQ
jgi:hypothetical protein